MRNFIFCLAAAILLTAACKGGGSAAPAAGPANDNPAIDETAGISSDAQNPSVRQEDFSFDQLFTIFSTFGSNILTDKFAAQSVKDRIRDELKSTYDGQREFGSGRCNALSYNLYGGDCYDGFQMGCWKYDADGHILVLLAENGGCDVSATKYIRAYEYDPTSGNAREVALPFNPAPTADDFNDIIRLAGWPDIPYLRSVMQERIYNYSFHPEGVTVFLNTINDWEAAALAGFQLTYRWNGSELVRDGSAPFPCIHGDGFAGIRIGEPIPDLYLQPDPIGYGILYSQGGDLWIVNLGQQDVLQIQMDAGKVFSVEVFDPRYSIQEAFYWDGKGKLGVGSRFNDYFHFGEDDPMKAWLYSDGTVSVEVENYNAVLSFRTTSEDLAGDLPRVKPGEVKIALENPRFKPEARVKSVLVQHFAPEG